MRFLKQEEKKPEEPKQQLKQQEPQQTIQEVEITLTLLNNKLNYIISKLAEFEEK